MSYNTIWQSGLCNYCTGIVALLVRLVQERTRDVNLKSYQFTVSTSRRDIKMSTPSRVMVAIA